MLWVPSGGLQMQNSRPYNHFWTAGPSVSGHWGRRDSGGDVDFEKPTSDEVLRQINRGKRPNHEFTWYNYGGL